MENFQRSSPTNVLQSAGNSGWSVEGKVVGAGIYGRGVIIFPAKMEMVYGNIILAHIVNVLVVFVFGLNI